MNDSPNISLKSDQPQSQSTSDNASSHGEMSSDNEMLDSETDSDDDEWEACEGTHVWHFIKILIERCPITLIVLSHDDCTVTY